MATGDQRTEVEIFGERYTLRSEDAPAHLHRLADFVDSKFRELARNGPNLAPSKLAVLVSVNIADELFKQSEEAHRREEEVLDRVDAIVRLLERENGTE
jgi:cell division protein ZapA